MIELTEIELYLPQLPERLEGLGILHIGDLHVRRYGPHERKLHEIMRQGCDLVVSSGDNCHQIRIANPLWDDKHGERPAPPGLSRQGWVFTAHTAQAVAVLRKIFADFDCPLGVYTIQGNHDPDDFMDELAPLGITVLANETKQINMPNGGRFNLSGVQCYGRATADIPQTLLNFDPALFGIALCHYPEMAEPLAAAGVDLVLTGHTHGGQVCLPNGRPLANHSRTGRKYVGGLERVFNSFVYTTRGLGQSTLPLRIFCPAEVTRLRLHHGQSTNTTTKTTKF